MSEYLVFVKNDCPNCGGSGSVEHPFNTDKKMTCRDCIGGKVKTLVSLEDALTELGIVGAPLHDRVNKVQIALLKTDLEAMQNG